MLGRRSTSYIVQSSKYWK